MDDAGKHTIIPFKRQLQAEVTALTRYKYFMQGLVELDITKARELLRCYKERTGKSLSFTAWLVRCVAVAVSENLEVQAIKKRNKLYIFEDVDVSIAIERKIDGKPFPALHVIRKANEKSLLEIHNEIRELQKPKSKEEMSSDISNKKLKRLLRLPKFIRKIVFWDRVRRNPYFLKQINGTVSVTAIGMFGKGMGGWGINLGYHSVNIVTGGITFKPRLFDGKLVNREFMNLSIRIDHTITDGAPSVRFGRRLGELIESAFELKEFCLKKN